MSEQRNELAGILMSDELMHSGAFGGDYALVEADAILAAGYRRVDPHDEATVERIAQAINERHDTCNECSEDAATCREAGLAICRNTARAVLAALEAEQ